MGERAQETLARVTSCFQTLVRVTSCFQQLAASLGSSADCDFLRQEITHARTLATNIADGLSRHLTRLLSDRDSCPAGPAGSAERRALERVWVHFLSGVENFLRDLRKAGDLIGRFPLGQQKDRRSLVNTGCLDGVVGVAARAASIQTPRLAADEDALHQEAGLQQHLNGLEAMMSDMQLRQNYLHTRTRAHAPSDGKAAACVRQVPVAFWSVEATQPLCGDVPDDPEDDLEEALASLAAAEPSACCRLGCAWS
ncbi:regulator of G-protein signaling 9-binding protein isoform X1 [Vanacampus margaritifer]